jgi:glycosyltransferase 2 family protein
MSLPAGLQWLAGPAGAATRIARTRTARVVGRGLAAGFLVFLAVRLWQLWRRDPVDLSHLGAGTVTLAAIASVIAVSSYGVVWLYVLRGLRVRAPLGWLTIFFKSQLGKYIPGSVWQFAGRVGIARRYGLPLGIGIVSVGVEVVASSLAAGAVGILVLSGWSSVFASTGVAVVLLAGVVMRGRLRAAMSRLATIGVSRLGVERRVFGDAIRTLPMAAVLYLLVWAAYGVAFWLTAHALFSVPVAQLPVYVGTFALAWLAGFVAVFAPGGVGVREAVIVALLGSRLGEANAIVLAASSRLVLAAVDLVAGGLSMSVPLLTGRRGNDADPLPGARG